jgi:hypothetical protein
MALSISFLSPILRVPVAVLTMKNCVAHCSAGAPIFSSHFFPKPNSAQSEFGEFLFDLSTKAILFGLATALSTTRKHPQPVVLAPNQQDFAALDRDQLGGLCHTTNSA